jgi:aspartate carbamoyltransferase catalytic subunit
MRKNIIFHHDKILLTDLGKKQAVEIMRLNRLWKIYLMDFESSARTDFSFESPSRLSPEAVLVLKQLESKKTSIDVIDPRSIDHTKY